jgi:hypothetical protein
MGRIWYLCPECKRLVEVSPDFRRLKCGHVTHWLEKYGDFKITEMRRK